VGTRLREGIQLRWRELRSIELVLEEVAGEFDGEAPPAMGTGGARRRQEEAGGAASRGPSLRWAVQAARARREGDGAGEGGHTAGG